MGFNEFEKSECYVVQINGKDRQTELKNSGVTERQADVKPVISSHAEVGHLTEGGGCYFRALLKIKAGDKSLEI